MDNTKKVRVAFLSVLSNSALVILKLVAGLMSGSVSIISEAIHSGMDLIAAIIAYFSVKLSSKPADRKHPYGHGKIENVSAVLEGAFILIASAFIIKEAFSKFFQPSDIQYIGIAIIVMSISSLVNFIVSRKLYAVARETDSLALEADALHLKTDIYTSMGVAIALFVIYLTGMSIIDPMIAIVVAFFIIREAWNLISKSFQPLLDVKLSDEEEEKIKKILERYQKDIIDYHDLKTRKAGHIKYIDFHMTVLKTLTVEESHHLTEKIEVDLETEMSNTIVNIHIEPGDKEI